MTARRVTGVVLAGGRSSRFGRDKLAERIDGRTLLDSAIDGVTPASIEILVVAAPDAAPDLPAGVRLVHDPVAFDGPLAGVAAGLRAAHDSIVLVVGGDMPTLYRNPGAMNLRCSTSAASPAM
jgi:molybdopterin-guanine dinucleotide biosynthesis protein A